MRVLVFGAYGRLGYHLSRHLSNSGFDVIRQGRSKFSQKRMDPTCHASVKKTLDDTRPDFLINLTAITDLKICEHNQNLAQKVNVCVPKNIARALNERSNLNQTRVIHISTDHVYSGRSFSKESEVKPINQYALSKLKGEVYIEGINGTVLRTNFIGKSGNPRHPSLTDWSAQQLKIGQTISAFNNVYVSALHYSSLCENVERVIMHPATGVFNVGCVGRYTKADVIIKIAAITGASMKFVKKCAAKYPDGIIRPHDMSMDVTKFNKLYGNCLPYSGEELNKLTLDY